MTKKKYYRSRQQRIDNNHQELVKYICSIVGSHRWKSLSQVPNFFDGILTWKGVNILVEFKTDKGKLSPGQKELHQAWGGPHYVIRNEGDVDRMLGIA